MGKNILVGYLFELFPQTNLLVSTDLVFEYSEWILREYPEEGIKIFTDDIVLEQEYPLEKDKIVAFLEQINPNLVIEYLESIIFNWNDTTTAFHDALINKYRERIRSLMTIYQLELHQQKSANSIEILDENVLESSSSLNSSILSETGSIQSKEYYLKPEPAGQEPGELGKLRRKLMQMLQESDHYTTPTLPTYLLHDGLFDERAIVMGKIGNHREALIIYVHILNDLQRAEEYCMRHYCRPDNKQLPVYASNKDVFFLFFEQCLKKISDDEIALNKVDKIDLRLLPRPQVNNFLLNNSELGKDVSNNSLDPNIATALAILTRHSTRIDLLRAIELLPSNLPLGALQNVLTSSMQHQKSRKHYVQILKQLLHSQRLRTQECRIVMEKTHRIVVTNMDVCQYCLKKIGKRFVCA